MRVCLTAGALFLLCLFTAQTAGAQQACAAPPIPPQSPGSNIFTPRQEMDLGDAVAEHFQRELLVIDDEDYTGYLQRVGDRLVKHLPPTDMKFRFVLFDLPMANAFSTPGGRIYVSRKMVAFLRSEDELASVLGHEVGHEVSRQLAMEMTERLRKVLNVTQVGDRQDIFQKYNLMVENARRKRGAFHAQSEQKGQLVADQIGLASVASAGYNPQSFADFFDRLAQTKGKTGGWLSDFFGMTSPESKRLREMIKGAAAIPAACIESRPVAAPDEFQKWQAAVVAYTGLGHKEQLHAVLSKKTLDPPLRADIEQLRFSPDGNYLLAQDESSIYVLTRQPLEVKFHFDAADARPAEFTPDSQEVVFYTPGLRVERWNVEEEQRTALNEVVIPSGCHQTALSPDGTVLACYGREWSLSLYDVASGSLLFEKKTFYEPSSFTEFFLIFLARLLDESPPELLRMKFSPDGHYFVASSRNETNLAYDLQQKRTISVPGSVRKLLVAAFAFLGPDRIAGVDVGKPANSAIVRFPSGEVVDHLALGGGSLTAAADPRYLLIRPIKDYPVGVMDLETRKIVMASKTAAVDAYRNLFVGEQRNGDLGLYPTPTKPSEVVTLPIGNLGRLRASAVSPDLKYMIISERTRGAVWNLQATGRMYYVRGIRGAYFGNDGGI